MWNPKILKLKGGYSSNANLIFQSCLKVILVHISEQRLSQSEAMQLVKDFTSDFNKLEIEYFLGMHSEVEQSLQGLIDQLSAAFQSGETENSLIGDLYDCIQKTNESKDAFSDEQQILVRKIIARKSELPASQ